MRRKDGLTYSAAAKALTAGGTVRVVGEHLLVDQADEVVIILAAASTFRVNDPKLRCDELLEHAANQGYAALKKRHIADYQPLFERVKLDLAAPADGERRLEPTAKRRACPGGR